MGGAPWMRAFPSNSVTTITTSSARSFRFHSVSASRTIARHFAVTLGSAGNSQRASQGQDGTLVITNLLAFRLGDASAS